MNHIGNVSGLYLKLLVEGNIGNEVLVVGFVAQHLADNFGFIDGVDQHFDSVHHHSTEGNEFGVLTQSGDGDLGEVGEEDLSVGISDEHPTEK